MPIICYSLSLSGCISLCLIMFWSYCLVLSAGCHLLSVSAFCFVYLSMWHDCVYVLAVFFLYILLCQVSAYSAHHYFHLLVEFSLVCYWDCMDWMVHSSSAIHNFWVCHLQPQYIFCLLSVVLIGSVQLLKVSFDMSCVLCMMCSIILAVFCMIGNCSLHHHYLLLCHGSKVCHPHTVQLLLTLHI